MWGGRFAGGPAAVMREINASIAVDKRLWREDVAASKAHAAAPKRCGERIARLLAKGSFLVPLAATLKQSRLHLDVDAANAQIARWITEVANCRVHATTKERPDRRLVIERAALLPLPSDAAIEYRPALPNLEPLPIESLQHPLSVYDELLGIGA